MFFLRYLSPFTVYCDLTYNHLEKGFAFAKNGGDEEDRTPDPLRARQVLSQLSYVPILCGYFLSLSKPLSNKSPRQVLCIQSSSIFLIVFEIVQKLSHLKDYSFLYFKLFQF